MLPAIDPVIAALASAVLCGTSVFLGGRASHHLGTTSALGIMQVTGFVASMLLLSGLAQFSSWLALSGSDLLLAAVSGTSFALGWAFLAHGVAHGRTTIVAPMESLTAVVFAAVAEGVIIGWPNTALMTGIVIAGVSAALIGFGGGTDRKSSILASLALGGMAGLCFGGSYLTLGFVTPETGMSALVVTRFFAAAGALLWVGLTLRTVGTAASLACKGPQKLTGRGKALALSGGVIDVMGSLAFVIATSGALVRDLRGPSLALRCCNGASGRNDSQGATFSSPARRTCLGDTCYIRAHDFRVAPSASCFPVARQERAVESSDR